MTTKGELDAGASGSAVPASLVSPRLQARAASVWDLLGVVPLTLTGAVLSGLVEAILDDAVLGPRAHAEAALLAGALGLVLGVVLSVAIGALRDRGPVLRVRAWLQRSTSRDRNVDRAPVLRLHALVIVTLALLVVWVGIAVPLFGYLLALQEEGLAVALAAVVSGSMIALAALSQPFARWLERPLARIDLRWPLPLPPQPCVRYFSYIALPLSALLISFAHAFGELLGLPGKLVAVPLVLIGAGVVGHVWRGVRPKAPRLRAALGPALLVVWCAGVIVATRGSGHAAIDRSSSPAASLGALLTRPLALFAATSGGSSHTLDVPLGNAVAAPKTFFGLSSSDSRRYNIVWVIIDALRADEIGKVHKGQSITPQLDRLVDESIVFERAYAQAPATSYSIPSMLSGRNVDAVRWGWAKNRPQLPDDETTIAERLEAHGYATAFVASQFIRGALKGALQGYTKTIAASGPPQTKRAWNPRTAPLATIKSLALIGELAPGPRASRPFFLTVYYGEPHSPYVRHEEFGDRFPDTEHGRYEAEISFVDLHLGQLIEHLRLRGPLWEDTIVIVTADHGEAFGEHGRKRHGGSCYVEVVHVPLILRVPGMAPARIDSEVALVDIVPTLLELVGAPQHGAEQLSGSSLLYPILDPGRVDPQRPIFCAAAQQRGDQKPYLQRTLRQDGFALFDWERGERVALYRTRQDPRELRDVIADPMNIDRLRRMQQLLSSSFTGNLEPPRRAGIRPDPSQLRE